MFLGFETNTGHTYEGANAPRFAIWPSPVLSQVKLIDSEEDWNNPPGGLMQTPFAWIFREDVFDPVSRIRRGRLYEPNSQTQPLFCAVTAHPFDHEGLREVAASGRLTKQLYTYRPCQSFVNRSDRGLGTTLVIGGGRSVSAWRVIQTEVIVGDDIMVTLKALSAFGILPELDAAQISDADRQVVRVALDRVVDAAFRETPISVVDHCRNAATVVLSRWLRAVGAGDGVLAKDLHDVLKVIENNQYEKIAARNAAEVIRLLHPRGKTNEQETKGLRVPVEEDAELAIHALGFLLREVGWAKR